MLWSRWRLVCVITVLTSMRIAPSESRDGWSDVEIIQKQTHTHTHTHTHTFSPVANNFVSDYKLRVWQSDWQAGCSRYTFTVCFLFIHWICHIYKGRQNIRNTSDYHRVDSLWQKLNVINYTGGTVCIIGLSVVPVILSTPLSGFTA